MGSLLDELLLNIDNTSQGKLTATAAKPIQRNNKAQAPSKATISPSSSPPAPEPPKKKSKHISAQRAAAQRSSLPSPRTEPKKESLPTTKVTISPPKEASKEAPKEAPKEVVSTPKQVVVAPKEIVLTQKQIAKESTRAKVTKVAEFKLPVCRSEPVLICTAKECERAIEKLSKYKLIAFDCEAVGMSRHGKLCLVQIATEDLVYLFDIVVGGDALFDSGLRWLLETDKILKVGHDCRGDSDILWYQHKVALARVFDTQVAFCVLCKQQGGSIPIPAALNTLIKRYAHGATNQFKDLVREEMEGCDNYWERRPMTHNMLQYASQDVIYLPFVWKQLDGLLSTPSKSVVASNCQLYLDQFRSLKERPLTERPSSPKNTPKDAPSPPRSPTPASSITSIEDSPATPATPITPGTPVNISTPPTPERFIPKYGIEEWDKEVAKNLELGSFRSGHLGGLPRRKGER